MINQNQLSFLSFGKRLDTGGESIIIGDNPAVRDLIPTNFFK